MWLDEQKWLPADRMIYCDECGFEHPAGDHFKKPTPNGSTPTDGPGSQPSPSDSHRAPALPSIIFVGLPDIWDDWLQEGLAILLVRKRGDFTAVNISTPSYSSIPIRILTTFTRTPSSYVYSVIKPGNGGGTGTEGR